MQTHKTTNMFFRSLSALMIIGLISSLFARLPDELPGEEISEEQYMNFIYPRDSIAAIVPSSSPYSPTWLDSASETWDAPSLSKQLAEDEKNTLMGMGSIFVPTMSPADLEPNIEIVDSTGESVESGLPGTKYSVMPGSYFIMMGSGRHNQRIVHKVQVQEGETTPVIPTWSGISIDVVDQDGLPFRGEYELARIDKFEPYGRGFGRDPTLGEEVRTWIVRPGVYKIFGVGESYNTLTNFVTVRLLPGEYVRFLLVMNSNQMKITSGGNVNTEINRELTSNWGYGINVGGSVGMSGEINHETDSSKTSTSLTILVNSRLDYKRGPIDWDNYLRLNQLADFESFDISRIESDIDELRISSIFTWRFFPWFGPYGRLEMETGLFPEYARVPSGEENDNYYFVETFEDSSYAGIDSNNNSYLLEPVFSPFNLEAGAGANMNLLSTRYFDARFLTGLGLRQEYIWGRSEVLSDTSLNDTLESITGLDEENFTTVRNIDKKVTRPEFGPEAALNLSIRLGRYASVESELKAFFPIDRMTDSNNEFRPDLRLYSTLSWRLARAFTVDYQYDYELRWPNEVEARQNISRHNILLRYSYSSR
ncbi:MAG: hypothetical protein ACOC41_00635 [Chitinivibrionales bacterium]